MRVCVHVGETIVLLQTEFLRNVESDGSTIKQTQRERETARGERSGVAHLLNQTAANAGFCLMKNGTFSFCGEQYCKIDVYVCACVCVITFDEMRLIASGLVRVRDENQKRAEDTGRTKTQVQSPSLPQTHTATNTHTHSITYIPPPHCAWGGAARSASGGEPPPQQRDVCIRIILQ